MTLLRFVGRGETPPDVATETEQLPHWVVLRCARRVLSETPTPQLYVERHTGYLVLRGNFAESHNLHKHSIAPVVDGVAFTVSEPGCRVVLRVDAEHKEESATGREGQPRLPLRDGPRPSAAPLALKRQREPRHRGARRRLARLGSHGRLPAEQKGRGEFALVSQVVLLAGLRGFLGLGAGSDAIPFVDSPFNP